MDNLLPLIRATHGPENLRPCFIGPTGSGKTARVKTLAEQLKLPMKIFLLQQSLPEDVAGLPKVLKGVSVQTPPAWAVECAKKPHLLFFDELDKPRHEVVSTILTLLWDNTIAEIPLHPETIIICAMQPVDTTSFLTTETGKALAARLFFVPIEYDWEWASDQVGFDLTELPSLPPQELPVLEIPSIRQITSAVKLLDTIHDEKLLEEVAPLLFRGICCSGLANSLTAKFLESRKSRASRLAKKAAMDGLMTAIEAGDMELAELLTLPELLNISGIVAHKAPAPLFFKIYERVMIEGAPEDHALFFKTVYEYLSEDAKQNGGVTTFCKDASIEEVIQEFERATRAVAEVYKSRGGQK